MTPKISIEQIKMLATSKKADHASPVCNLFPNSASCEQTMALMNGLRLYTKPASPDPAAGNNVFYSRRSNGPIYRWLYEAEVAHWRVLRMHTSDFTSRE